MAEMALRASRIQVSLADALETARKAAKLSQDDLWFRYKQAGGTIGLAAFKNYLRGLSDPQWNEYDCIAEVLNEALGEERLPRVPFRRTTDNGGKAPQRDRDMPSVSYVPLYPQAEGGLSAA